MLIGICGSICSGRSTVARYLVEQHGFTHVYVSVQPAKTATTNGDGNHGDDSDETHKPTAPSPLSSTHNGRTSSSLVFASPDDLLEHVTQHWRERWVVTDVLSKDVLDAYLRRPFFLLISVDAPLLVRWERYRKLHPSNDSSSPSFPSSSSNGDKNVHPGPSPSPAAVAAATATTTAATTTLEAFAHLSDTQLYDPLTGHATHLLASTVRLLNNSSSLSTLHSALATLDLLNPDRLRPSWDTYFMSLASLASHRSNCMKRRVGCVIVSPATRHVISTGYNGTPRGIRNCNEGGCPRCNSGLGSGHGLATCLCIHAEENALLEAGRDRLREGAVLYCDTCPCLTCSIKIAQVGVREVVYAMGYSMDRETAEVFREAGVKLRQFVPPANGLIHLETMELTI